MLPPFARVLMRSWFAGAALEGAAASAGSTLTAARDYATEAGDKLADANYGMQQRAHDARLGAVDKMREAGAGIAHGAERVKDKASEGVEAAKRTLGLEK